MFNFVRGECSVVFLGNKLINVWSLSCRNSWKCASVKRLLCPILLISSEWKVAHVRLTKRELEDGVWSMSWAKRGRGLLLCSSINSIWMCGEAQKRMDDKTIPSYFLSFIVSKELCEQIAQSAPLISKLYSSVLTSKLSLCLPFSCHN